ncbi:PARP domain containing protein [Asbolus verrucosus]|uniref:Poly [ADP-ribose] polymerase n=1 Tax=Asbolus verrucosus TaxID=1661398 RepID=A0A482VXZ9_ASBVE|nr:PARP domain containing protein [Asbolus verrucosus]
MASNWSGGDYSPCKLITLDRDSSEFRTVQSIFSLSSRGLSINRIDRVENPFLLGQFLMKKDKMNRQNISVSEESLFHGTMKSNVDGICRFNFDWRRNGQSRGHKFGQGVSFTPEVSYAKHYTSGHNIFFLVKVLVGRSTFGNTFTTIPPTSYDTTRNTKNTVFVKYEDDDFYPQYVIHCPPLFSFLL